MRRRLELSARTVLRVAVFENQQNDVARRGWFELRAQKWIGAEEAMRSRSGSHPGVFETTACHPAGTTTRTADVEMCRGGGAASAAEASTGADESCGGSGDTHASTTAASDCRVPTHPSRTSPRAGSAGWRRDGHRRSARGAGRTIRRGVRVGIGGNLGSGGVSGVHVWPPSVVRTSAALEFAARKIAQPSSAVTKSAAQTDSGFPCGVIATVFQLRPRCWSGRGPVACG